MILANIEDYKRYEDLVSGLHQLFEFVTTHDLSTFPLERIVLNGDALFINMAEPTLKKPEDQKLEVHHRYIDVHFPLTGEEICGWSHLSDISVESDAPFDEKDDYAVYSEMAQIYFKVKPGQFYIVFPEDAHAPIIGEGKIKKAIAKVLL